MKFLLVASVASLGSLPLWLSCLTRRVALRLQVRIPCGLFCFVVKFDFEIDCRHFVFLLDLTFKLSKVSVNYAAYSVN